MAAIHTDTLVSQLGDPDLIASYLERPGVLQYGHYELLSGLHTDRFIAFSHIANDRVALDRIAGWLLTAVAPWTPTGVMAPSTAGVSLAANIARRLSVPLHLASLDPTGRANGIIGVEDLGGQSVLLVNDLVTTGDGLTALAETAGAAGASISGAAWFLSRADVDVSAAIGCPSASIAELPLPAWAADECELCSTENPLELALDLN